MTQNFDMAPTYIKYIDEYDISSNELKFKSTTSKEAIQAYLVENVYYDKGAEFMKNSKAVSDLMIEQFKATNCYNQKSEIERQEIIDYLKVNTSFEIPKFEDTDTSDDGNDFHILY